MNSDKLIDKAFSVFKEMENEIRESISKLPNKYLDTSSDKCDRIYALVLEPETTDCLVTAIRICDDELQIQLADTWWGLHTNEDIWYAQTIVNVYEFYEEYL